MPWSSEEARRFLESARADRDVIYAAYVLILVLGLRKGEVLGLRWEAVDLGGRELVIDHQVQRVRRELLYRETKTDASDATLPMPEIVATPLVIRRDESRTKVAPKRGRPGSLGRRALHRSLRIGSGRTHAEPALHRSL